MNKNKIDKDDGRYLIYYTFEGDKGEKGYNKFNNDLSDDDSRKTNKNTGKTERMN